MYLVNTHTLELEEFENELETTYCTLSHRWLPADQEVSFRDIASLAKCRKTGVAKLKSACQIARSRDFDHIWVDTCCIDKNSSASLSESINSMWKYYETGQDCFAFLADFIIGDSDRTFAESSWFTRSWTLQELLAPLEVTFFDASWHEYGTRSSMSALISSITGIHEQALHGLNRGHYSIAQRMSWSAKREATRTEDFAYSLMGLFNVNMPMLYGEGWKAFTRLQEEIIKHTDDQSIFAWSTSRSTTSSGLLAPKPGAFSDCHQMIPSAFGAVSPAFTLNSRGVDIDLGTVPIAPERGEGIFRALLEVVIGREEAEDLCVGIYLESVKGPCNFRHRITYQGQLLWTCPYSELSREFFHKQRYCVREPAYALRYRSRQRNHFKTPTVTAEGLSNFAPGLHWNSRCEQSDLQSCTKSSWLSYRLANPICSINLTALNADVQFVHFGFDEKLRPVCFITDSSYIHKAENIVLSSKRSIADLEKSGADNDNSAAIRVTKEPLARFLPTHCALEHVYVEYLFAWPWSGTDMRGLIPHTEHYGCWAVIGKAGQDLRFYVDAANARGHYVSRCADMGNNMQYKMSVSMMQKTIDSVSAWHFYVHLPDAKLQNYGTATSNIQRQSYSSEMNLSNSSEPAHLTIKTQIV